MSFKVVKETAEEHDVRTEHEHEHYKQNKLGEQKNTAHLVRSSLFSRLCSELNELFQ